MADNCPRLPQAMQIHRKFRVVAALVRPVRKGRQMPASTGARTFFPCHDRGFHPIHSPLPGSIPPFIRKKIIESAIIETKNFLC